MSKSPKTDRLRELREQRAKEKESQGSRIIRSFEQALTCAKGETEQVTVVKVKASPKSENETSPKSACQRNARWRDKNRERYNESQKEIMRRKTEK
jgi:hypothetical protein